MQRAGTLDMPGTMLSFLDVSGPPEEDAAVLFPGLVAGHQEEEGPHHDPPRPPSPMMEDVVVATGGRRHADDVDALMALPRADDQDMPGERVRVVL
jgi:hypothetical protein